MLFHLSTVMKSISLTTVYLAKSIVINTFSVKYSEITEITVMAISNI